jgi:hypothetical protein
MLNILLFYLKRNRMGYFYFADRRIDASLSISPAVHESAFGDLSVGRVKNVHSVTDGKISWHRLLIPRPFALVLSATGFHIEMKLVQEHGGHAPPLARRCGPAGYFSLLCVVLLNVKLRSLIDHFVFVLAFSRSVRQCSHPF